MRKNPLWSATADPPNGGRGAHCEAGGCVRTSSGTRSSRSNPPAASTSGTSKSTARTISSATEFLRITRTRRAAKALVEGRVYPPKAARWGVLVGMRDGVIRSAGRKGKAIRRAQFGGSLRVEEEDRLRRRAEVFAVSWV